MGAAVKEIIEILQRGYWTAGVFDNGPQSGGGRIIRIEGKFDTEAAARDKSQAVIDEGRPNIATFIHKPTARPSVHFNILNKDLDELGRALTVYRASQSG